MPAVSAEAATDRLRWWPWCRSLTGTDAGADAAVDVVLTYLLLRLPVEAVGALVRTRLGWRLEPDRTLLAQERAHCERVRAEVTALRRSGVVGASAAAAIDLEYALRLAALGEAELAIRPAAAAAPAAPAAATAAAPERTATATATAAAPPAPPGPAFSFRELVTEHSVVILASLGAFLLVVATVLFELFGSGGLGGGVRLVAVVALDLVFAAAGWFALGQERLRAVGRIYVALAAVLLPLAGVAAWTFLALGEHGITVNEALAATGAACAVTYGLLARRLDLLAYGEMAGVAALATVWGVSGAVGGDYWAPVGLGLTPLVYAVWQRLAPSRVFAHFPAFAHASALVAALLATGHDPSGSGWLWTATLGAIAAAYLAWQALAPHPSRAWAGEAAVVLAAAAATGPLGGSYRFALPLAAGVPLLVLARAPGRLGAAGRLYRSHPAHLHLAVAAGIGLALAESATGEAWPLSLALWIAFALYAADFWLGASAITGYAMRAGLPLALAATGRALGWGTWTAVLVAGSGLAYLLPHLRPTLGLLTRHASLFFYASLALVAIELRDAAIGTGRWQLPAALLVSAAAFGIASELGAVRFSDLAARALFSGAWFLGVEALGARGWRGPFDAVLVLLYTALGQLRATARHAVATARRREFVHAAAVVSVGLCFAGPGDLLWWRLAAALGLLAVAYWWLAASAAEAEMPLLAWSALAASAGSLAVAVVPEPWQGAAIAGGALALTGGWAAARRVARLARLEESALPVLLLLTALAAGLTLREAPPRWSQAAAAVLAGGVLLAWSLLRPGPSVLRQSLRAGAAALATTGALLCGAVLRLDVAWVGLVAVAIAAAHAEWHLRARGEIERWYALAALLAMALVLLAWPHAGTLPSLVALEFLALSALATAAAIRGRRSGVVYPAVLLLAPGVHFALAASGLHRSTVIEEAAMAGLAGAAGVAGLALHTRFAPSWARMAELGAATIAAGSLLAMGQTGTAGAADAAGIALLAYAPIVYTAGMQERERWVLPAAAAAALVGAFTLLAAHGGDTILYAAALGVVGLAVWAAGRLALRRLRRHPVVEMHRHLGLGLLGVAAVAGFAFPGRTGPASLGGALAAGALLITGGVLWLDARAFGFRPNLYLGAVSAAAAGYFVARELDLQSWELVSPGLGLVACGIRLREERGFAVALPVRQAVVGLGMCLVMGWAAARTVSGDPWWLVALLLEGALAVGAGIVSRSRVLLAGAGAALALVSLRALLTVAQAGLLFVAFGAVALALLAAATALALARDRYRAGARGLREQLARWD